jgi:septal ring factor EnvC (AmiA/AmiB activator)
MAASKDSNIMIGKALSLEFLVGFILMAFSVGGSWAMLSAQAEATEDKVHMIEEKQKSQDDALLQIQLDLESVKSGQEHVKEDILEIKGDLKDVLVEIRAIHSFNIPD